LKRGLAFIADNLVAAQRGANDRPVPQVAGFLGGARFEIGSGAHAEKCKMLNR